jgi:hypothetical protein
MAKKMLVPKVLNFVAWMTGVIVSLAVGFAMTGGALTVPWLTNLGAPWVAVIAGWIVVIATLVGVVLAILKQ